MYEKIVADFSRAIGWKVADEPIMPDEKAALARIRIIREELDELEQALKDGRIENAAKELADLQYVVSGAVGDLGLIRIFPEIFRIVHQSNMTKLLPDIAAAQFQAQIYKSRGVKCEIIQINGHAFGVFSDGKLLKPTTYRKADLRNVFKNNHQNE